MSKSWQDEHWVKLYTEDDADWLDVPGPARSVFYSLMRRCDKAGRIRLGRAGMKGLAKLIDWPWEMLKPQIDALVLDGCLSMRGDGSEVLLRNFAEAQASRTSDAQRKRMQRERESVSQQVTANHSPSPPLLSSPLLFLGLGSRKSNLFPTSQIQSQSAIRFHRQWRSLPAHARRGSLAIIPVSLPHKTRQAKAPRWPWVSSVSCGQGEETA